ncbi:Aste57867_11321 [Aphanomyces stellatus]|uniref:Aste57867_11321 protein n=1 Tax=Aphanomyces stellatus TaxID=120398 RepID=A0A485KSR2_9STRA|nr:hypothetical protein As57867_011279 [Aphanomyces stellatus]VFT88183.1 Aste57867_11321 [Aphanomyces stellatus]
MLATSKFLIAALALDQTPSAPCSDAIASSIQEAMTSCVRATAIRNDKWAFLTLVGKLSSETSILRGEFCAGTYSPGCDALAKLSTDPTADCSVDLIPSTPFNFYQHAFCDPNGNTTRTIQIFTVTDKVVGVDNSSFVVAAPRTESFNPTFVYDFTHHNVQIPDTNECWTWMADQHELQTSACDPANPNQRWTIKTDTNRIQPATQPTLCVEVDPMDEANRVSVAACELVPTNDHQFLTLAPPVASDCGPFDYDVDIADAEDLMSYEGQTPSHCCSYCQSEPGCVAFSWVEGVCFLKKEGGNATSKRGVVSGVVPSV